MTTTDSGAPAAFVRGPWRAAEAALSRPVDAAWLAAMRVLFGASMLISMLRFLGYGWIDDFFLSPPMHFKYWGFAFVEPLPRPELYALFWALSTLALAVMVGFRHRVAGALFLAGFVYIQLIDVTTYLNHYYLASLVILLLTLAPASRVFSVDAMLDRRRHRTARAQPRESTAAPLPADHPETVAAFWLYAFRFQVGVVYTFAGFAKAQSDWLLHAQPLRIWLGSQTDLPILGAVFGQPWAPSAMSLCGFLFDSTVVWFLLYRRTRPFAYAAVLIFHTLTGLLFPIGMFPVIMALSALVFFPPEWPRRLLARVLGRSASDEASGVDAVGLTKKSAPSFAAGIVRPMPSWAIALAGAYCVVQIAVPLRFLAYGGNVLWHEQGMRFSWRVMVREKNGSLTFFVREKHTGRTRHVSPRGYITRIQEREISAQPDLILQLAHHVRDDFEARGFGPVEVRVEALVSLNGRRLAPLIDPDVDLTTIRDGHGRASWILPSPTEPPPHTTPI